MHFRDVSLYKVSRYEVFIVNKCINIRGILFIAYFCQQKQTYKHDLEYEIQRNESNSCFANIYFNNMFVQLLQKRP